MRWVLTVCLSFIALASPAFAADHLRLKLVRIQDTSGFEKPVEAFTVLVPADWQTAGGVVWQYNARSCGYSMPYVAWKTTAPDGVSSFEIIPAQSWGGMSYAANPDGCPQVMVTTMRDYMAAFVAAYRGKVSNYRYRDLPQRAEELNQSASRTPTAPGGEVAQYAEAGEASFEWTYEGRRVREKIALLTVFSVTRNPGALAVTANQIGGYALRAPAGGIDPAAFERFTNTFRINPGYGELIRRFQETMQAIALKGVMERAAIWRAAQAEISRMIVEVYQNAQAAYDRASHARSRAMLGLSPYIDPATGATIELPTSAVAWQMPDGTIIISDDPNFDPAVQLGEPGTPVRPDPNAR